MWSSSAAGRASACWASFGYIVRECVRLVPSRLRICSSPLQHPRLTCAHRLSEDVKKDALFIIIIWDPGAAGA